MRRRRCARPSRSATASKLHADIAGLLNCKLDAVVIAAPDPFHPELAVAALEAGLHVMCEKPLALTVAGCDRIAAARDRAGRVLQVAYMKRTTRPTSAPSNCCRRASRT